MKRSFSLLLFALFLMMSKAASATTWYVRADGGTRYSSNATSGQCDGQADAAYPGSGVNQHCAFGDYRFLYDDQHSYNQLNWAIQGGDTVILDNTKQWRVGWDGNTGQGEAWCPGGSNGPYGCYNPTIPGGTAQQHTRILGRNYASCSAGNQPNKAAMTQIFGGHGVWTTLNLQGAQFVDVECIEVTRHSNCIGHGYPAYPSQCTTSIPVDDYDSDGVQTDASTHDLTIQDMWIHGHTDRGIIGPIGGTVTAKRIDIDTNGMAGWDLDRGDGTTSPNGVLNMSYVTIEWSGCNQEYPLTDSIPVASCYSQSTGGYGDGMGTPITPMQSVSIDHSIFRYNTQDGEDFGHISLANSLSITNSASYGNNGGQWKFAGFQNVLFQNNLAVANCLRMSQPITGAPSTFNANLSDYCRAFDAMSFDFNNNATAVFTGNTLVTYAPTTFDVQCYDPTSCANTTVTMTNNITLGYQNPTTWNNGGQQGGVGGFCGVGCNGSTIPLGTFNRANNIFAGFRGCPANQLQVATAGTVSGEMCIDPQFSGEPTANSGNFTEAELDGFNFALSSGSPAVGAGIATASLTVDYLGASRRNPPSLGGLEYGSQVNLTDLTSWLTATSATPTTPTTPSTPTTPTTPTPKTLYVTKTALSTSLGTSSSAPLLLTATVTSSSKTAVPQGAVLIYSSTNQIIATGTLNASGTMTWQVPSDLSKLTVYAVYIGSSTFATSKSTTLNEATALATLY